MRTLTVQVEWIKNMGMKKSFVLLSALAMAAALLLIGMVFAVGANITKNYPRGGIVISSEGMMTELEVPTQEQENILRVVGWAEILACIVLPVGCLGVASLLFYRWKLREPIAVLRSGTERIRAHDLAFTIPEVSSDELGQLCAAFETMRAELLKTNQELWRQAEERKRLNAAFSHDLRNPVMVLKGTVKLLRQGVEDAHALERLETYVLRLERYVEAMSGIQRLEQMPVQKREVRWDVLRREVEDTAGLLAVQGEQGKFHAPQENAAGDQVSQEKMDEDAKMPVSSRKIKIVVCDEMVGEDGKADLVLAESVTLDHGLFLTVAENLIGNAARYARSRIDIGLRVCRSDKDGAIYLTLSVRDDGAGYPAQLLLSGPKPFGKLEENAEHFGMGLYTSQMLCARHRGTLLLENAANGGARATAVIEIHATQKPHKILSLS